MLRKRFRRGFSLIEVVVVAGMIGVVSAVGVSAYNKVRERNAFSQQANDILSAMRLARGAAFGAGSPAIFAINFQKGRWGALLDRRAPEVRERLASLSTVLLDQRFVTLEDAPRAARPEQWNFFRLLGEGWGKPTPWD